MWFIVVLGYEVIDVFSIHYTSCNLFSNFGPSGSSFLFPSFTCVTLPNDDSQRSIFLSFLLKRMWQALGAYDRQIGLGIFASPSEEISPCRRRPVVQVFRSSHFLSACLSMPALGLGPLLLVCFNIIKIAIPARIIFPPTYVETICQIQ